jgi:DNA-directed RNA polymerase specialized sigma24 family protein
LPPFEDVVAEYGPMVLRVCRAVLGPTDAADAWSETFLSALRAYPDLDPKTNIEAWLVTIAHRRAIDVGRALTRANARHPLPTRPITTPIYGTHSPRCRPHSVERWPTATWRVYRMPKSLSYWAIRPMPPGAPPPTALKHCASSTRRIEHDGDY